MVNFKLQETMYGKYNNSQQSIKSEPINKPIEKKLYCLDNQIEKQKNVQDENIFCLTKQKIEDLQKELRFIKNHHSTNLENKDETCSNISIESIDINSDTIYPKVNDENDIILTLCP